MGVGKKELEDAGSQADPQRPTNWHGEEEAVFRLQIFSCV
jgi:hypothetical protein